MSVGRGDAPRGPPRDGAEPTLWKRLLRIVAHRLAVSSATRTRVGKHGPVTTSVTRHPSTRNLLTGSVLGWLLVLRDTGLFLSQVNVERK